jgi:hypothetical protein
VPSTITARCPAALLGLFAGIIPIPCEAVEPSAPSPSLVAQAPSSALGSTFDQDLQARRNYWLPAAEILGFDLLVNQANRRWSGSDDYNSNINTIRHNLHSGWAVDHDPFNVNQLAHPYQGSMYHGFARSAGFGFWESFGYTFAGSALWEIAGEKTQPSGNDQVASGIGGAFLGEALFRMASLVLEQQSMPKFWRELTAAAISPATGFNRLALGQSADSVFSSRGAEYYSRAQLGASRSSEDDAGLSTKSVKRNEAIADFAIDYGLPGNPDYTYDRPFDHFTFEATATTGSGIESVFTRGSLFAFGYGIGRNYRGVAGVYGNYDYLAPQTFRVSTTGLSVGTTGQWKTSDAVTMQGTIAVGAGYSAAATIGSSDDRDYHYGIAPLAVIDYRAILNNKLSFDFIGHEYFVSRIAAAERGGHENVSRIEASLTYRIQGPNAISLRYLKNARVGSFPGLGDRRQTRDTIGVFYTLLGHDRFGAVEW